MVYRFAGKHQLIPVGTQVFFKIRPEILLGSAGHRAVVVRHIDVRDAAVECGAQHGAHIVEGVARTEVMPQPQRNAGQLQAAFAAACVLHRLITALVGGMSMVWSPLCLFFYFEFRGGRPASRYATQANGAKRPSSTQVR